MRIDGETDKHNEADSCFPQICKRVLKPVKVLKHNCNFTCYFGVDLKFRANE